MKERKLVRRAEIYSIASIPKDKRRSHISGRMQNFIDGSRWPLPVSSLVVRDGGLEVRSLLNLPPCDAYRLERGSNRSNDVARLFGQLTDSANGTYRAHCLGFVPRESWPNDDVIGVDVVNF